MYSINPDLTSTVIFWIIIIRLEALFVIFTADMHTVHKVLNVKMRIIYHSVNKCKEVCYTFETE